MAVDIANSAVKYLKDGIITNAINAPRGKLTPETEPFVPLAEGLGVFANHLNAGKNVERFEVTANGSMAEGDTNLLRVYAVKGFIRDMVGMDNANLVNAEPIAKSKGVDIKESKNPGSVNDANILEIKTVSGKCTETISGTVFGDEPRLVGYNGYSFNVPLAGNMVFLNYTDKTGVVGAVGTVLGKAVQFFVNPRKLFLPLGFPVADQFVDADGEEVGERAACERDGGGTRSARRMGCI